MFVCPCVRMSVRDPVPVLVLSVYPTQSLTRTSTMPYVATVQWLSRVGRGRVGQVGQGRVVQGKL